MIYKISHRIRVKLQNEIHAQEEKINKKKKKEEITHKAKTEHTYITQYSSLMHLLNGNMLIFSLFFKMTIQTLTKLETSQD